MFAGLICKCSRFVVMSRFLVELVFAKVERHPSINIRPGILKRQLGAMDPGWMIIIGSSAV